MITLLLLALAPYSGIRDYPADADCQKYADGSTAAIAECLKAQSEMWERLLNDEYQAALRRREIDARKLRSSQRAWLRYRNANCDALLQRAGLNQHHPHGRLLARHDPQQDARIAQDDLDGLSPVSTHRGHSTLMLRWTSA